MSEPARWYPSKIDWWIGAVLAIAPVMSLVATVGTFAAGAGGVIALSGFLFLLAIYFGLVLPMKYGITDDKIVVKHGLIKQSIPLRDIVEVSPTNNPLSSPALSLDRLLIRFGDGFFKSAMISPKDKQAFLTELAAKAKLQRKGDSLVRA